MQRDGVSSKGSVPNRLLELDALRGLAAVAVVIFHYAYYLSKYYGETGTIEVIKYLSHGVNLFFMISGYVIFLTLSKTKHWFDFIVSRFSRLYPAYWTSATITFSVVFIFGLPGLQVSGSDYLINLSMLQGFLGVPHVDNAYWTLTYELIFYGTMLLLYLAGYIDKALIYCSIFLFIQMLLIGLSTFFDVTFPDSLYKITLMNYGHQFIVGIAFYKIHHGANRWPYISLIVACLAVEAILPEPMQGNIVSNLYALLGFCIIFALLIHSKMGFLSLKPLVGLGLISYSFYLVHQHLGYVIILNMKERGYDQTIGIILAFIVGLIVAVIINRTIEIPAMKSMRLYYKTIRS